MRAEPIEPIASDEITELPVVQAAVVASPDGSVRVNTALAEALAARHRVRHRILVRDVPDEIPEPLSPEEKMLRAIFAERDEIPPDGIVVEVGAKVRRYTRLIQHRKLWVSFTGAEEGEVESAVRDRESLPKKFRERITVIVGWDGPMTPGDELWSGSQKLGIVEAITRDGSAEPRVYLPSAGTRPSLLVERRLPTAAQRVRARSIGPYSIVTQNPITGERVRPKQIEWLACHGGRALVGDFASYKGADVLSRTRLYETMVKREPVDDAWTLLRPPPQPAPPAGGLSDVFSFFEKPGKGAFTNDSLRNLDAFLRCLGMGVEMEGHSLTLFARMPVDGDSWSHGEVRKPETLNYRTYKPEFGGLFCAKIFGPVADYECYCGKYKRMKHRGIVCEKCGVEVIRSAVRRERFGHVSLSFPVVPHHFRRIVDALLGEKTARWRKDATVDGGASLRERLEAVDPHARAAAYPDGDPRRALLAAFAASGIPASALLWDTVPVLPPDLRPLVPLDNGRFATSDLNDLYRRVVNRNNRLKRLLELNAPEIILQNERKQLNAAVQQLLFNGLKRVGRKVLGPNKKPLTSMFEMLKWKLQPIAPRRTDYSGSATVLVGEASRRAAVPFSMVFEIARPLLYGMAEEKGLATTIKGAKALLEENEALRRELLEPVLAGRPFLFCNDTDASDAFAACEVEIGEDPVIRLPRRVAERLALRTGDRAVMHLALSGAGVEEAKAMMLGEPPHAAPAAGKAWLEDLGTRRKGIAKRLVQLALVRANDPCVWPHAALLVGGYDLSST